MSTIFFQSTSIFCYTIKSHSIIHGSRNFLKSYSSCMTLKHSVYVINARDKKRNKLINTLISQILQDNFIRDKKEETRS